MSVPPATATAPVPAEGPPPDTSRGRPLPAPHVRLVRLHAAVAALTALSLAVLPSAAGAQDATAELEVVQQQRAELEARIDDATARLEELEAELATREQELAELDRRRDELMAQVDQARDVLGDRARAAFKRGGGLSTMEALLTGEGPTDALDRASTLDVLSRRDATSIESTEALTEQLAQTEALRQAALDDLDRLRDEAAATSAELTAELGRVKLEERDLKARAGRQVQISRGAQNGTYACMMQRPYSYIDSWGFARSGGRRHKGTDVMAPYGNEVYAFTNGTVRLRSNSLGGITLYLNGDDGHRYYYAHLDRYAPGIGTGTRVEAGQLVAYNGNSGNARGGAAHVHFEVQPGGGASVNPYPWLTPVCRR